MGWWLPSFFFYGWFFRVQVHPPWTISSVERLPPPPDPPSSLRPLPGAREEGPPLLAALETALQRPYRAEVGAVDVDPRAEAVHHLPAFVLAGLLVRIAQWFSDPGKNEGHHLGEDNFQWGSHQNQRGKIIGATEQLR